MAEKEKDEEKKEEGAADGHGEAKPKGKGKLIIIVAAAVVLIGGAAAFFLMGGEKKPAADGEHAEEHAEEEHKHLVNAELDNFIVNLSETSNFLKIKLLLEIDEGILHKSASGGEGGGGGGGGGHGGGDKGGLPAPLDGRVPMIRDAIIRVLSAKKASDVLTVEGKDQIKEELVEAINEASGLEEGPIVAVYFIDFIVQ